MLHINTFQKISTAEDDLVSAVNILTLSSKPTILPWKKVAMIPEMRLFVNPEVSISFFPVNLM